MTPYSNYLFTYARPTPLDMAEQVKHYFVEDLGGWDLIQDFRP
jgi:hypothetical protein